MINVDIGVKQVAIVKQGEPITKQQLCIDCGYGFTNAFEKARETHPTWAVKWMENGYMKIVLKCPNQEEYDRVFSKVISNNLPFATTNRILVIGPMESGVIDEITGNLKLL